jgi:hypothetical protein
MRAIIEIFLAIIFSVVVGTSGISLVSSTIKKESIQKLSKGLGSLESFTKELTKKE